MAILGVVLPIIITVFLITKISPYQKFYLPQATPKSDELKDSFYGIGGRS